VILKRWNKSQFKICRTSKLKFRHIFAKINAKKLAKTHFAQDVIGSRSKQSPPTPDATLPLLVERLLTVQYCLAPAERQHFNRDFKLQLICHFSRSRVLVNHPNTMEDSCYMTRTLPSKMRIPNSTSVPGETQLGPNSTMPAPWASSLSSYQKHIQPQHHQQQQQYQQHQHVALHSNVSKGYRTLNGVVPNPTQKVTTETHSHHFPPPRPFSQTLPHNKYQYPPVQNPAPAYQHHQAYHPPSAVYAQSKVASVQSTHMYNRSFFIIKHFCGIKKNVFAHCSDLF